MIEQEDITDIMITSGFGHNTQQPYVQMLIEKANWMTQMSPATARELAFNLLGAADSAESDGFVASFIRKLIGVDDKRVVVAVLSDFREYREEQRQIAEGVREDEDNP